MRGVVGWLVHRITGAVLVLGMALHFAVMHLGGPETLSYGSVVARLENPIWVVFNIVLLMSAVYHGFYGLWGIALEYISSSSLLKVAKTTIASASVVLVLAGLYILTF